MHQIRRISFFVFLLSVYFFSPAMANENAAPVDGFLISPFLGGYIPEGNEKLSRKNLVEGLRLGYRSNEEWSTELVWDHTSPTSGITGNKVNADLFHVDTLYHFGFLKDLGIDPFLAAGIGAMSLDQNGNGSTTNFMANWGIGAAYPFENNWALRGDLRHVLDFRNPTYNNLEGTLGIVYLIDE